MRPPISHIQLSPTLGLSECHPDSECSTINWWLYDGTREMNLAMRAKTRDAAFVEALSYYQLRLSAVEKQHAELSAKVDAFVSQFAEVEDSD